MTLQIDLSKQVVIVTGASQGIGAGIAYRLAQAGATVVVHFRSNATEAGWVASEIGGTAIGADLQEPREAEQLVSETVERHGFLTGLVNNAGLQTRVPFQEMSPSEWSDMLEVNLTVAHRLTQLTAQAIIDGPRVGGWVTHIASIEGLTPAAHHSHYAVTKAGLIMHAKAAALELGGKAIRVNAVSPGLIDRRGLEKTWPEGIERWMATVPLRRIGGRSDVGNACAFLASDLARWITGINLTVDGGMSAHPAW